MTGPSPDSPVEYLPPPPTLPPAYPYADGPAPALPNGSVEHGQWALIGAPEDVIESGRSPRRWWRRLIPRTLTTRLVAGVVTLVVVLVLATSICTYIALRSFLFNRLDQQLDSSVTPTGLQQLFSSRGGSTPPGVHAPQRIWAVAILPSGEVDMPPATSSVEPLQLDSTTRQQLFATSTSVTKSIDTQDGEHLRITTRHATLTNTFTGESVSFVAVVGLSTGEVDRTLGRLVQLELIIGLSAIVLALAATGYGVRYSLRRLRSVSTTAREVAAELSPSGAGLERRVEVDEPETEVGQLAESMNTLLSAVETQFAERVASEERMRRFLADASHELRTPLTSIRGYAELARMQGNVGDQDNLSRIEAEGTRMSRLVDDLLTLARTDQGGERRHELLDVADVLTEAIDGVRAAHPERRIDVSAEHGLTVAGDRDQLVRVVRNLATNAAVHTRPDGPIHVSAVHDGGFVVIRVADAGPGLPPEEAAHVFERFWRADKARTRAKGGSGLGLAIVDALVQGHGGQVQFDSSVANGSTVTVRLPRL